MAPPAGRHAKWARRLPPAIGLAAALAVATTLGDAGVTWDEPPYLEAAQLHLEWLGQVAPRAAGGSLAVWISADTLAAYWHADPYANPHPPLTKVVAGLGWAAFGRVLGDYPAFRLASALLFGALVAGVGLWTARAAESLVAGAAAALALALMPRVVGDAHVAATDLPLAVLWALATWAFWIAARGRRLRDALIFGVLWGLALGVKFSAFLLPVPLAAWALLHGRRGGLRALVVGGLVAAVLFVALHPWLWPDPLGRALEFVRGSTSRQEWAAFWTWYAGRRHVFVLPWHHALVLTLVTVPLPLLVAAAAGAIRLREPRIRPLASMAVVQVAFWQLLMALPSSPGHDGVRLFLPQFPFLAILAGLGFAGAWRLAGRRAFASAGRIGRARARTSLAVACFLPPAAALALAHPHELAFYNEVIGGARGAEVRGFESSYWFDAATPGFLRSVERVLPRGARVWAHPAPWHWESLQEAGLLRRDLVFTDQLPAPWLLLMTRQGVFRAFEWRLHESVEPVVAETHHGVTLMALYRWN